MCNNLRDELPYIVECNSNGRFYETIAAFNVLSVALDYGADCKKTNPNFIYRVDGRILLIS